MIEQEREAAIQGPCASSRRGFLRRAGTGMAGVALLAVPGQGRALGDSLRTEPSRGKPSAGPHPWGRLEPVGDGLWALLSSPLADHPRARLTLCNGGIIAGRDGVLVVEAFASPEGGAWMAGEALRLTGMRPTHVVLTHYHGDHVGGGAGFLGRGDAPRYMATRTTRRLMVEQEAALDTGRSDARLLLLPDVLLSDDGEPMELDLGGRTVRLTPRRGHTPSDLVVTVDDVVFAGDLVWAGMFPNYMDAIPSELGVHVRAIRAQGGRLHVSGHGDLATPADLDRYIDLLDHVEAAARRALDAGRPLEEAGAAYEIPASLGTWHMFSPRYPEVAFRAWARELGREGAWFGGPAQVVWSARPHHSRVAASPPAPTRPMIP